MLMKKPRCAAFFVAKLCLPPKQDALMFQK